MKAHQVTTPFGRRTISAGQIAAQLAIGERLEQAARPGDNRPAAVNKWRLFRTLTAIRERLGLSDRTLGVLDALLSFHPETALTLPAAGEEEASPPADLVVFPSNRQLMLRAHGMAEKTLRRHLAALVAAGLIVRRDSPNGKRYARRAEGEGALWSEAYGFDLTPLVVEAPRFEALAEEREREARRLKVLAERITLHRRDIRMLIAAGEEAGLAGDWRALGQALAALSVPLRGLRDGAALEDLAARLGDLRRAVTVLHEAAVSASDMTGNDGFSDRHHTRSNIKTDSDSEPDFRKDGGEVAALPGDRPPSPDATLETKSLPCPLGLALEACPDIMDYAEPPGIRDWPALLRCARTIRPMLGISPDAWEAAVAAMGEPAAAVAVAVILQRSEHSSEAATGRSADGRVLTAVNGTPAIRAPGGYLRALTAKAAAGGFAVMPVLIAILGQRRKARAGRPADGIALSPRFGEPADTARR
jgi:replication initiation protein RepC